MLRRASYHAAKALNALAYDLKPVLMTSAAVGVAVAMFYGVLLVFHNVETGARALSGEMRMHLLLKPDVDPEAARALAEQLTEYSYVARADVLSSDEVRDGFLKAFPERESVLEGLNFNPFPCVIEVSLTDAPDVAAAVERAAKVLSRREEVEQAVFAGEAFRRLSALNRLASMGGLLIGLAAALASVFLIFNSVKLALYARREEIEVLHLVGATRGFIIMPFVIEGMIQGGVGALIGLGAAAGAWTLSLDLLADLVVGASFKFAGEFPPLWWTVAVPLGVTLLGGLSAAAASAGFLAGER